MVIEHIPSDSPDRVAVIGAGMVGLATAWFLQERGVQVTVLDREGVAAGASWGNAGWLTPGLATPLPEPAVLRYGIGAVFNPSSPVYVPPSADPRLLAFLAGFVRHSTTRRWQQAMRALVPINAMALDSFDTLAAGGVQTPARAATSLVAAYRTEAERTGLLEEIDHIRAAGQDLTYDVLTGDQARSLQPVLSGQVGAALVLHGQRFIDPGAYVHALADAVRGRGGRVETSATVTAVADTGRGVRIATAEGENEQFDAVVLATGAWLGRLARQFGVRRLVQAGRGYSFTADVDRVPDSPVYLPAARVACTPIGDAVRFAGSMELRAPETALDPRRIRAIVEAARPLLVGVDLEHRRAEWVGSRPVTADGLPLIGATRSPRVFAAGGHGMWGITLGPATGRLLAQQVVTGTVPDQLRPFTPLR